MTAENEHEQVKLVRFAPRADIEQEPAVKAMIQKGETLRLIRRKARPDAQADIWSQGARPRRPG